jgi:phosphatidylserine decarboxylase
MVKEAYPFLIPLLLLAALLWALGAQAPSVLVISLALFVAFFFRDPERKIPTEEGLIVAPADGKVVEVSTGKSPDGLTLIGIFLSPLDVHINRSPVAGRISGVKYKKGKFLAAFNPAAAIENEQNILTIQNPSYSVTVKQIAGVLARRIVCWKKAGDLVQQGERIGLIRFGSRTDVLLPPDVALTVKVGDRVKGGESVIGRHYVGR